MRLTRNSTRPLLLSLLIVLLVGPMLTPSTASAHQTITMYEYHGAHPVPEELGTWCHESALHVHTYLLNPSEYAYYEVDGVIYFVGDPTYHGHGTAAYWYYDPHPIHHLANHWCVLEGPHSHVWAPHRRARSGHVVWVSYDNYWVYEGAYDSWFWWSWSNWYERHWRIHVHRSSHYRHYHPSTVYRTRARVRPRYDGRHRHVHRSDHRMQSARSNHSHWRSGDGHRSSSGDRYRQSTSRNSGSSQGERIAAPPPTREGGSSNRAQSRTGSSSPKATQRSGTAGTSNSAVGNTRATQKTRSRSTTTQTREGSSGSSSSSRSRTYSNKPATSTSSGSSRTRSYSNKPSSSSTRSSSSSRSRSSSTKPSSSSSSRSSGSRSSSSSSRSKSYSTVPAERTSKKKSSSKKTKKKSSSSKRSSSKSDSKKKR